MSEVGESRSRAQADREVAAAFEAYRRGEVEHAYRVYRRVLAAYPDHALALHYLGLIAQHSGQLQEAARLLGKSLEIAPDDPLAHNHLGNIFLALGDRRRAATCFEKALEIDPDHPQSLNNCANAIKVRDLRRAISLYRRALELRPHYTLAAYNLAIALKANGEPQETEVLLRRVLEMDAKHGPAHHSYALLLEETGRIDAAIEHYLEARRVDPRQRSLLANLLGIEAYRPDEGSVLEAEELLRAPDTPEESSIRLHRGLGRHFDRQHQYDRAFEHFAQARAIVRRQVPAFDIDATARSVDELMKLFTREFLAKAVARPGRSARPVFMVGMPHSGTDWAGQLLAGGSAASFTGDRVAMGRIVKSMRPEYPRCVAGLDAAALNALAEDYLTGAERRSWPDASSLIDTMPANFMHLGMIATLFPEARVVHCKRDPRDVGLACFSAPFLLEQGYASDLETFAGYYRQYERLMAHWREALPMQVHEIQYEAMLQDPQGTARALAAHCEVEGCGFEKVSPRFEMPMGEPGHWRRYAAHLAPLLQAFGG